MKKLIVLILTVFALSTFSFSQDLTRAELTFLLTSATADINNDMGKDYTVGDMYRAYSSGVLTFTEVGVKTFRYQFGGCVDIIFIDDR